MSLTRLRVQADVHLLDRDWASVDMFIHRGQAEFLRLTHEDRPLLVARQGPGVIEPIQEYASSALMEALDGLGIRQVTLIGAQAMVTSQSASTFVWQWWADIEAGVSVAIETYDDGTVGLLGLR